MNQLDNETKRKITEEFYEAKLRNNKLLFVTLCGLLVLFWIIFIVTPWNSNTIELSVWFKPTENFNSNISREQTDWLYVRYGLKIIHVFYKISETEKRTVVVVGIPSDFSDQQIESLFAELDKDERIEKFEKNFKTRNR